MALPSRDSIVKRLEDTLDGLVWGTFPAVPDPPAEIKPHLDEILRKRQYTVRDGMLTLLAMAVEHGRVLDWHALRVKGSPARPVSRVLGTQIYPRLHIQGSGEALESGVKGTGTYLDRSNEPWRAVLLWASIQPDITNVEAAFHYLAAGVAATARSLPEMPALDTPKLTFPRVFGLVDHMLGQSSGGAHEQFIFAALLDAWREQMGEPGVVETKNLNASDASSGTAADVQEKHRGQVTAAYEITASAYTTKVEQAKAIVLRHDLRCAHILARDAATATGDAVSAAIPADLDLTVLDVREEVRSLLARLGKPGRRAALERLYVLLVDRQPSDALVQAYVTELMDRGLTEPQ